MSRARHISSVSKEADRSSSDFSLFLYQSFLEGQAWSWYHPHHTCNGVLTAKIWQIHHVLHVKPWKMSLLFTKQPQSHNRVSTETFFSPGSSKRVTVFWIRPDITVYNSTGWTASTEFITRLLHRPFQSNPQLPHVSREISQYRALSLG